MAHHTDLVALFSKDFLLGNSECGMVAAKTTILAWTPHSQAASLLHTLAASTISLLAQRMLRSVGIEQKAPFASKSPDVIFKTIPYKLDFACDFMIAGNCTAALQAWNQSDLQKKSIGAKAALAKDQANYNSLKASCDAKKQTRVQAQSSLDSAESA